MSAVVADPAEGLEADFDSLVLLATDRILSMGESSRDLLFYYLAEETEAKTAADLGFKDVKFVGPRITKMLNAFGLPTSLSKERQDQVLSRALELADTSTVAVLSTPVSKSFGASVRAQSIKPLAPTQVESAASTVATPSMPPLEPKPLPEPEVIEPALEDAGLEPPTEDASDVVLLEVDQGNVITMQKSSINPSDFMRQANKAIGERLKGARVKAGLSPAELAIAMQVTPGRYCDVEKGLLPVNQSVSAAKLALAAVRIGVPIGYFFQDLPEMNEAPMELVPDNTREKLAILSHLDALRELISGL